MLKYSLILIGIYVLYYAGNIVYDLFLKKEKTAVTDESEEFSLVSFAKTESPPESRIEIDDVENIRTPKSFQKVNPPVSIEPSTAFDEHDLEELRRKFEAEEELDGNIPTLPSAPIFNSETVGEKSESQEQTDKKAVEEIQNEHQNQTLDGIQKVAGKDEEKEEEKESEIEVQIHEPSAKEQKEMQWRKIITLAQTSIKMMKNYDGEKVYHSTM